MHQSKSRKNRSHRRPAHSYRRLHVCRASTTFATIYTRDGDAVAVAAACAPRYGADGILATCTLSITPASGALSPPLPHPAAFQQPPFDGRAQKALTLRREARAAAAVISSWAPRRDHNFHTGLLVVSELRQLS